MPLVPMPAEGEALTGYLDRVAAANGQTREQLYDRAGLPPITAISYALAGGEIRALTTILGISRAEVLAMTLAGYRAFATVCAAGSSRPGQPLLGLWPDVAAQCPACHAERPGVYALRTINGVGFACVRHRLLHVERCPGCGNSVRLASTRHGRVSGHHVPRPGFCEHSLGPRSCGYPLAELPRSDLTEWPAALEAQRMIDEFCAAPSCASRGPTASITVLAALARWLLHPSLGAVFSVPEHLGETINASWRYKGAGDAVLNFGRRSRTCVALVMSAVAPGYLAGDAVRLAADLCAVMSRPRADKAWHQGLPHSDPVVAAAVRIAFPAGTTR
jgi:hypothetical protein